MKRTYQPLPPKQQQQPYRCGFCELLFIVVFVMVLSGVSLFVALNRWLADETDRTLVHEQNKRMQDVQATQKSVVRVLVDANQQNSLQDALLARLDTVNDKLGQDAISIQSSGYDTAIDAYDAKNATIQAARASCNTQLTILETVLGQLIQGFNATPTDLQFGACAFKSANSTQDPAEQTIYTYRKLVISGLDFFYYVFDATVNPVLVDQLNGQIQITDCSPPILLGQQVSGPLFRTQVQSKLVGSPQAAASYISGIEAGAGQITLLPANGASFVNQTFVIQQPLTLWLAFT